MKGDLFAPIRNLLSLPCREELSYLCLLNDYYCMFALVWLGRCCSYYCFEGSPAAAATTAAVAAGSVLATTTARIDVLLCLRPLPHVELLPPCYSYIPT